MYFAFGRFHRNLSHSSLLFCFIQQFFTLVYCLLPLASSPTFRSWQHNNVLYCGQTPTRRQPPAVSSQPSFHRPFFHRRTSSLPSAVFALVVGYKQSRWWLDRPTDTGDFEVRSWCASPAKRMIKNEGWTERWLSLFITLFRAAFFSLVSPQH